ncbi:MAG: alcohol dehydrogenase catalytic domain-containing protein, partial [Kiritimatiellia bacterium]|nr:alcohol dehydrogenase catalytic domain-containing protein [Kiritimatiellia bacterium]
NMISRALFGKKYLNIEERQREVGPPAENHVTVKIHACGVCGTDLNFVRDWPDDPMALGHEIAGEVVAIGKSVTTVKPGDKVIVEDCAMCGVCENCKSGHPEFCREMFTLENQPGMGEYICVRYNLLHRFEGLDYKIASLTEPLAVALTSVLNAEIALGNSVAVLGNGPLGLMAAKIAKLRGAGFVAITGLSASSEMERIRFEIAPDFGCDLAIESAKENVEEAVKKRFPKGVDRVIVSSPPQSIHDALKIIRFGGIISFFGLHFGGKNKIEVDINDLIFRKITLRPTFAEPAINFPVSYKLLRDKLIDGRKLITHTFGFDKARDIFKGVIEGNMPIVKAVMCPHGG